MTEGLTALQRLIKDQLATNGDSYRAASGRSHGLIDHSVIHQIATGKIHGDLSERARAGLALALQCSEREVNAAIEETLRPKRILEVSSRLAKLAPERQAEVIAMIEKVLDEHTANENGGRTKRVRRTG